MIKDLRDSETKLLTLLEDPIYDENAVVEPPKLDAEVIEVTSVP